MVPKLIPLLGMNENKIVVSMDGWMDGWMDRWIDGWMDGWMDG